MHIKRVPVKSGRLSVLERRRTVHQRTGPGSPFTVANFLRALHAVIIPCTRRFHGIMDIVKLHNLINPVDFVTNTVIFIAIWQHRIQKRINDERPNAGTASRTESRMNQIISSLTGRLRKTSMIHGRMRLVRSESDFAREILSHAQDFNV